MSDRPRTSHPPGAERRQWERIPLVVVGEMILRDELHMSLSQNISGGGMFLLLPGLPRLGDVIQLRFRLGGREILVQAEVVWASGRSHAGSVRALPVGAGVKFINMSKEDRAHILAYVEGLTGARQG